MGLIGKLKEKALSKIIAMFVHKLAEGDFGDAPAKVYWQLSGKKSWIAAAVAIVGYALQHLSDAGLCAPCSGWVGTLYAIAGVLGGIGLYDGALRQRPPSQPYDLRRVVK